MSTPSPLVATEAPNTADGPLQQHVVFDLLPWSNTRERLSTFTQAIQVVGGDLASWNGSTAPVLFSSTQSNTPSSCAFFCAYALCPTRGWKDIQVSF